jgi:hypothetical protein
MAAKHTPGPWVVWDYAGHTVGIVSYDGEPLAVAEVVDYGDMVDPAQMRADANLIAAAPDMLAALKAFEAEFADVITTDSALPGTDAVDAVCYLWPTIKAALAKARGDQ